jgi:hypothetical protein
MACGHRNGEERGDRIWRITSWCGRAKPSAVDPGDRRHQRTIPTSRSTTTPPSLRSPGGLRTARRQGATIVTQQANIAFYQNVWRNRA